MPIRATRSTVQDLEDGRVLDGHVLQRWADRQQTQDVVLAPISEILIDRAKAVAGERIIDIGCGCGTTSVSLAQKVGSSGHVLGIDISAPMLARAQQIAPAGLPLHFALADATVYPFQPESFDLLVSLGTRPRTGYLARLINRNPELA